MPKPVPITDAARAMYMQMSDVQFDELSVSLGLADKQSLVRARFLARQQLGELSAIKSVKSAQVAADEAGRRLHRTKQD